MSERQASDLLFSDSGDLSERFILLECRDAIVKKRTAALVKTAPELLAMVKRLSFLAQTANVWPDKELVEALDAARVLIAKATGESQ